MEAYEISSPSVCASLPIIFEQIHRLAWNSAEVHVDESDVDAITFNPIA
jgi:hypothetical protein